MKTFKRRLAMLLVLVFVFAQMQMQVLASVSFPSAQPELYVTTTACPYCEADCNYNNDDCKPQNPCRCVVSKLVVEDGTAILPLPGGIEGGHQHGFGIQVRGEGSIQLRALRVGTGNDQYNPPIPITNATDWQIIYLNFHAPPGDEGAWEFSIVVTGSVEIRAVILVEGYGEPDFDGECLFPDDIWDNIEGGTIVWVCGHCETPCYVGCCTPCDPPDCHCDIAECCASRHCQHDDCTDRCADLCEECNFCDECCDCVTEPYLVLSPQEVTINNYNLYANVVVSGTAESSITIDTSYLPQGVTVTYTDGILTVAGERPAYNESAIYGTFIAYVARGTATVPLTIHVNLTPQDPPPPQTTITINFPGMSNVGVRYSVSGLGGGWRDLPGRYINTVSFEIPSDYFGRITVIEVFYDASTRNNNYRFEGAPHLTIIPYQENVFNAPVIPLRVFGINSPNTVQIGVMNPGWIYNMHNVQGPVEINDDLLFNVFRNERDFTIRLTNPGQTPMNIVVNEHNVVLHNDVYEIHADFENPFYSVTVPAGVTGVRVAGPGWIVPHPGAGEGAAMWFLRNYETGNLDFMYDGVRHNFQGGIVFDGTCIFCQVEMPPCPGCGDYCTECCDEYPDCAVYVCDPCTICGECLNCGICLPFSLRHYYRPNGTEMHRLRFNNPVPPTNLIPAEHFTVTATLPDGTCALYLLAIFGGAGNTIQRIEIGFGDWERMTVTVSRGCAQDTIVLVNSLFVACDCGECDCEICDADCDYCPYCGECLDCSECLAFSLRRGINPSQITIGFNNPINEQGSNTIPFENFRFEIRLPDGSILDPGIVTFNPVNPVGRDLFQMRIPRPDLEELITSCWTSITVWVSRGCADAEIEIVNPNPICDQCDYCGECLDCSECECAVIVPTLHRISFMRSGGTLNGTVRDIAVANVPSGVPFNEVPVEIPVAERAGYTFLHWRLDFAGPDRDNLYLTCAQLADFAIPHGHLHAPPENSNLIIRAIWEAVPVPPCDCNECEDCGYCYVEDCECEDCEKCECGNTAPCNCNNLCELCRKCPVCDGCNLNLPGAVLGRCIVDLADLIWLYGYLRGSVPANLLNYANADMNGDGIVNWVDYYLLEDYLGFGPNNRINISFHAEALM